MPRTVQPKRKQASKMPIGKLTPDPSVRYPRPHPLKEVLEHYDISVEGMYEILDGWPDRPSLSMLSKMLEGHEWMPSPLEAVIWRKIYYSFGPLWILVGGFTADGPYLTHDGRVVDLVERESEF